MTDTSYRAEKVTEEKLLGKIDSAEFGLFPDRPFMYGLMLSFSFSGVGIADGGKYTVNISANCRWEESERQEAITKQAEHLRDILRNAKCNYVSELKNKPVEVTIQNNTFKSFRILTEVL